MKKRAKLGLWYVNCFYFIFWHNTPKQLSKFEFWVSAGKTDDGKLVTCTTSSEDSVKQCHGGCGEIKGKSKDEKKGQQMKGGVNNRGVLQIAVSETNKRSQVQALNVMSAFSLRLHKLKKFREGSIDSTGNHRV